MSLIATVEIPASKFVLGSVLGPEVDGTLSVETTIPTSQEVLPYLWVPVASADPVIEAIRSQSAIESASRVDRFDEYVLVKLEWNRSVNGFLEAIRTSNGILTSAEGSGERWTFQFRFLAYDDLTQFYTDCTDRDIPVEIVQLHEAVGPESKRQFGLTRPQRDLILSAYDDGYFDVPRRTSLVELGDAFGVSDSAVSQRLRRGLARLIESTLAVGTDEPTPAAGNDND